MKKLLFLLLFLPLLATAQRHEWDIAYVKGISADFGKAIYMPPRDYNPNFNPTDTFSYGVKSRVYIIRDDSDYQKMFYRHIYTSDSLTAYKKKNANRYDLHWMTTHMRDSVPVIDFSKYELVVYAACAQCLAFCDHTAGKESCHRNACNFRESFYLRARKPGLYPLN